MRIFEESWKTKTALRNKTDDGFHFKWFHFEIRKIIKMNYYIQNVMLYVFPLFHTKFQIVLTQIKIKEEGHYYKGERLNALCGEDGDNYVRKHFAF